MVNTQYQQTAFLKQKIIINRFFLHNTQFTVIM